MKKNKHELLVYLVIAGVVVTIGSLMYYWWQYKNTPGNYDSFATCLGDKGAKFYGAFWCPHCQAQKSLFGKSKDKLPYVECSTADTKGQTEICKEKEIKGYPTWIFADGTRTNGEQTLTQLSQKTGCVLPK